MSEHHEVGVVYQPKVIEFDGHKFFGQINAQFAPLIEMIYRARHGDDTARLVLDTFNIVVTVGNNETYWPMADNPEIKDLKGIQ